MCLSNRQESLGFYTRNPSTRELLAWRAHGTLAYYSNPGGYTLKVALAGEMERL